MNRKTKIILGSILALLIAGLGIFWYLRTFPLAPDLITVTPDDVTLVLDTNNNGISDDLDRKLGDYGDDEDVPVIISARPGTDHSTLSRFGAQSLVQGVYIAKVTKDQLKDISQLDAVLVIEEDQLVRGHQADDLGGFGIGDGEPADSNPSRGPPRVAVLDSGVDPTHPLVGEDRVVGWYDAVNYNSSPYDDESSFGQHGTRVSATLLSNAPDNTEMVGVKVLGQDNQGQLSDVVEGLRWVSENADDLNIKVVNLSLGFDRYSYALSREVDKLNDQGIIVVAATGNEGRPWSSYPAVLDNTISVGAFDPTTGEVAEFSNYGTDLDVVADGVNVIIEKDGQLYNIGSGTSFASPDVAAQVLELLAEGITDPDEIKEILRSRAEDIGRKGRDRKSGSGYIPPKVPQSEAIGRAKPEPEPLPEPEPEPEPEPSPGEEPPGDEEPSGPSALNYSEDYALVLTGLGKRAPDGNSFELSKPGSSDSQAELQAYLDELADYVEKREAWLEAAQAEDRRAAAENRDPNYEDIGPPPKSPAADGNPIAGLDFGDQNTLADYRGVMPRYGHTMTVLQDGRVLIVGGTNGQQAIDSIYYYDPATNTVNFAGKMKDERVWHTASLLSDGNVLILGGRTWDEPESTALKEGRSVFIDILNGARSLVNRALTWLFASDHEGGNPLNTGEVFLSDKNSVVSLKQYLRSKGVRKFVDGLTGEEVDNPAMHEYRAKHTATYIPATNQILILGGQAFPEESVIDLIDSLEDELEEQKPDLSETVTFSAEVNRKYVSERTPATLRISIVDAQDIPISPGARADIKVRIVGDATFADPITGRHNPNNIIKEITTTVKGRLNNVEYDYELDIYGSHHEEIDRAIAVEIEATYTRHPTLRNFVKKLPGEKAKNWIKEWNFHKDIYLANVPTDQVPDQDNPDRLSPLRVLVFHNQDNPAEANELSSTIFKLGHKPTIRNTPLEIRDLIAGQNNMYSTFPPRPGRRPFSERISELSAALGVRLQYNERLSKWGQGFDAVIMVGDLYSGRRGGDEPDPDDTEEIEEEPEKANKIFSIFQEPVKSIDLDYPGRDKSILYEKSGEHSVTSAGEILDLNTGAFLPLNEPLLPNYSEGHFAQLLEGDKVLIAGGDYSTATLYDASVNEFIPQSQLQILKKDMVPLVIKDKNGNATKVIFMGGRWMTYSDATERPWAIVNAGSKWLRSRDNRNPLDPEEVIRGLDEQELAGVESYDIKSGQLTLLPKFEYTGKFWEEYEKNPNVLSRNVFLNAAQLPSGHDGTWSDTYIITGDRIQDNRFVLFGNKGSIVYDADTNKIEILFTDQVIPVYHSQQPKYYGIINSRGPVKVPPYAKAAVSQREDGDVNNLFIAGGRLRPARYPVYAHYSGGPVRVGTQQAEALSKFTKELEPYAKYGSYTAGSPLLGAMYVSAILGPYTVAKIMQSSINYLLSVDDLLSEASPYDSFFKSVADESAWLFEPNPYKEELDDFFKDEDDDTDEDDEVVGSSDVDDVLDRPNPPAHEYEGELLHGGDPEEFVRAVSYEGSEYTLDIEFDKDYINPAIGSTIKGTVQLLQDGVPVDEAPDGLWPVRYGGAAENPTGTPTARIEIVNTDNAASRVPRATEYYEPGVEEQLYVPEYRTQATYSRGQTQTVVGMNLSDGKAEFEYRYGGGRTHAFVEFRVSSSAAGAGYEFFQPKRIETRKAVYFEDQVDPDVKLWVPPLVKTRDFHLDVKTSLISVGVGRERLIRVDVVSRDPETGKVNASPFQRVQVQGPPVSRLYNLNHVGTEAGPVNHISAGHFIDLRHETATDEMQNIIIRQRSGAEQHISDYVAKSTFDLINGRGTTFFQYTGDDKGKVIDHIVFVVAPVPYDFFGSGGGTIDVTSHFFKDAEIDKFNLPESEKEKLKFPPEGLRPYSPQPQHIKDGIQRAIERKYWKAQEGIISYREEAGIAKDDYPPRPGDPEDPRNPYGTLFSGTWYSNDEFKKMVGSNHVLKPISIDW